MNNISRNYRTEYIAFISALLSGVIAYAFELTHFTLSIDEENMDNYLHMVDFGRWGHAALKLYIFPEPWTPFFSIFFALVAISGAASVCSAYLKWETSEAVLFAALFSSFPQMAYQLQFNNQAETVGLAILLSSISALARKQKYILGPVIFIILNLFVASIYQSLLFFSATLITVYNLKEILDGRMTIKEWIKDSFVVTFLLVITVALYMLITKQIKEHYDMHSVSYFSSMIAWGGSSFNDVAERLWGYIKASAYTIPYYGLNFYFISTISIIVSCLISIRLGFKVFIASAIVTSVVLASPFFLNIIIGSGTPARTLSQMPLVFSSGIVLLARHVKAKHFHYAIAAIFVMISCNYVSKMFYSDYVVVEQDKRIAYQLISAIHDKYPQTINEKFKLVTYGSVKQSDAWSNCRSDDFGVSFFSRGDSTRIGRFVYSSGIGDVIPAGVYDLNDKQKEILKGMEVWRGAKGIEFKDGVVIVKLSEQ